MMSDDLGRIRAEIDRLDNEILSLLSQRLRLARDAAETKWKTGMPVVQAARMRSILEDRCARAEDAGVPEKVAATLWRAIFEEAHRWDMERRATEGAAPTDSAPGAVPGYGEDAIVSLSVLRLKTPDRDAAITFLEEKLGARRVDPPRTDTPPRYPGAGQSLWAWGALTFALTETDAPGPSLELVYHTERLGLLEQDLRERGAPFEFRQPSPNTAMLRIESEAVLGVALMALEDLWQPPA